MIAYQPNLQVSFRFEKIFRRYFLLTVNHPNTTFLVVFEKLFLVVYRKLVPKPVPNFKVALILPVKGAGFLHLSKNSFPLNHANRTVFDLFRKIPGNKKDRDRRQRTDDLSSVLPDSHGHPDISSIYFVTLAFARLLPLALFPQSEYILP